MDDRIARLVGGRRMVSSLTRVAWIAALVVGTIGVKVGGAVAQEVISDSYVVTYREGVRRAAASSVAAPAKMRLEGREMQEISLGAKNAEIRKPSLRSAAVSTGEDAREWYGRKQQDVCDQIVRENADVATCSPNWVLRASALPNDPQLQSLWGLTGANGIAAPEAWNTSTGSSDVVAAIIDTGIDYTHPDLAANVWTNPGEIAGNGIDDDGDGVIDDIHGANFSGNGRPAGDPFDDNSHGTHVAGTIGAVGNNSLGVVGINWHVKLLALKFLGASGSGSTSGAIQALNYLITLKGKGINVKVVNNSWGGGGDSAALRDAIERASTAGILFTAAAGNSGQNIEETPQYPAAYNIPNMLKVAAIDSDGNLANFSNYGARLVEIAAPGVGILSTVPGNHYASYSGTSMATPHVTGAAALYLSAHPTASVAEIKAALIGGGRDLDSLAGIVSSGRTLDIARAMNGESHPVEPPVSECPYAISAANFTDDTAADRKSAVITSDEDGFYRVSLPFSFPFEGVFRNSLVVSPNGVVYFGGAPTAWDNHNQSSSPANAIAVLHDDLYPDPSDGNGLGVRVATSASKVTIAWKARLYGRETLDESVIARLTLLSSGAIQMGYAISSSGLEDALAGATIGVRGASAGSSSTYGDKPVNGLKIQMIPGCMPAARITHVDRISVVGVIGRHESSTTRGGAGVIVRASVTGTGTISLIGRIDGKRCELAPSVAVNEGSLRETGTVPAGISAKRISLSLVGADGLTRTGRVLVRKSSSRSKSRRAMSTADMCSQLMKSFN